MEMPKSIPALMDRVRDEVDAYELLEDVRWKGEPACPHCGATDPYFLKPSNGVSRKTRTGSMSVRRVWKCRGCRKQFSVLTGTIFHGTKIPVRTWLFVIFEMCASKNGVAAREIERKYGLTPKSAWFMLHRIREAMKREPLAGLLTGTIIADETWIGGKPANRHGHRSGQGGQGATDKQPVIVADPEGDGARPLVHAAASHAGQRDGAVDGNVSTDAELHTDESAVYTPVGSRFAAHRTVNHSKKEYVREGVTTNAAEGYFSQLKRSLDGTHHHVTVRHLPRYLAEHDFRYSTRKMNDAARSATLIEQVGGRRLSYKPLAGE